MSLQRNRGLYHAVARVLTVACITLVVLPFAYATDTVVCGDDDNNGVQGKLKSAGLRDRDCDGETDSADGGTDCDDTNIRVHSGSYTSNGCSAGQYRYCDAGKWKTGPGGSTASGGCTSATLAECATNYYVDAGSGSDGNAGTFNSPFATFAPVTHTNGNNGAHSTFSDRTCVYFKGTTDLTSAVTRTPEAGDAGTRVGFETQSDGPSASSKNILARYPTSTAKLNFSCDATNQCTSLKLSASNWIVRGFELTAGYGTAVKSFGSNTEVFDNYIHDVPGGNDFNQSGFKDVDSVTDQYVHHNIINNVYDPTRTCRDGNSGTCGVRQNVWMLTFFTGNNKVASNNIGGYSHAVDTTPYYLQGGCLRFKHGETAAATGAASEFRRNILYNCEKAGIWLVRPKNYAHGNLIKGASTCDLTAEGGNSTFYIDAINYSNNTCVTSSDTGAGLRGAAISVGGTLNATPSTALNWHGNITDDSATSTYGGGNNVHMVTVLRTNSDSEFTSIVTGGKLVFADNCYYNSSISGLTNGFNLFGDNSSSSSGSIVNFSHWVTDYSISSDEFNENPSFDTDMRAASADCTGRGWEAEWPGRSIDCDYLSAKSATPCF